MKLKMFPGSDILLCFVLLLLIGCAGNLPDLTLDLYDIPYSQIKGVQPYPPLIDRQVVFSVLMENDGDADVTDSFTTKLYVDDELIKTWTFPLKDEQEDSSPKQPIALKSGDSRIYDADQKFSKPGSHRFRWVVDAENNIKESDEQNNILDTTFVWQAAPDLIVKDIYPEIKAVGGQKLVWKIIIRNEGAGDVNSPFLTTFMPDAAGGMQENFWRSSLKAKKSDTLKTTQWFNQWGKVNLTATVDAAYSVAEVEPNGEKNNELTKQFDLSHVDLKIESAKISPQKSIAYDPVTISFVVKNSGTGDANQPFKVRIFPGIVKGGVVAPTFLSVVGLKAGQSIPLKHKISLPPGSYQVDIEADAFTPQAVYFEPNRLNNVWHSQVVCPGMRNGRLFTLDNNVLADQFIAYVKNDPELDDFRQKVALTALKEMQIKPKLCGDSARNQYDASGNWCSEFVAWVLRQAGMKDIKYCSAQFLWCWNNVYLHEVTLTKELVKLFDRNSGRFKWRTNNQVTKETANTGDFISMTTNGKKKNHSAITLAVSIDGKTIWTAEGNVGDCLWMGPRDYFKDGKTCNPEIDGIGKIDAALF